MEWIFYVIIIGAVIGWIAGLLMKGGGFGLLGNIVVGILGAVVGGWLTDALNISLGSGLVGNILTGVLGAVVLLFVVSILKRR
ncbi:MAG: GlsB/YeaQ/YmgE family stress response membrane protein [Saprospiraceae bacterium]|nr:GlsB/YeaQ/YmgE family stress response membrane protein [Saprospiraceae bacterium]